MIQQKSEKRYKFRILIFEASLGLDARIIYIEKPFLEKQNSIHLRFNLY